MKKLVLYHGTTADFQQVDLTHCRDKKDFGKGFYLTTDFNQAKDLAVRMKATEQLNYNPYAKAYVYKFELDMQEIKGLDTHAFKDASISWLDYIIFNRFYNVSNRPDYDIISGKVADNVTNRVIAEFINKYGRKATSEQKLKLIEQLKPERYTDQYCFKTEEAIQILNKVGFTRKGF